MTLNGVMALISPNSVASCTQCVKVVEDVVVKKFAFTILSPDVFIVYMSRLKPNSITLASSELALNKLRTSSEPVRSELRIS